VNRERDLRTIARSIIDSNVYMTLGTADEDGRPWVSPVYYAAAGYAEFYWMSRPAARHSQNLASRPEVSIVIFDSAVPIGTGQAVYMSARAQELAGADIERGIAVYPGRPDAQTVTAEELQPPGEFRLYRATVSEHWILEPGGDGEHAADIRVAVTP
jgi:hypothetical protein